MTVLETVSFKKDSLGGKLGRTTYATQAASPYAGSGFEEDMPELGHIARRFLNPLLARDIIAWERRIWFKTAGVVAVGSLLAAVACGVYMRSSSPPEALHPLGHTMFGITFALAWLTTCILLPLASAIRTRSERRDGEIDLLSLAGLRTERIMLGYLQECLFWEIITYAILLPAFTLSWFLYGIPLSDLLLACFLLITASVVLIQGGLLLGATRMNEILFPIVTMTFLLAILFLSTLILGEGFEQGWTNLAGNELVPLVVSVLAIAAYFFLLTFVATISLYERRNRNRTFWLRLCFLATALLMPLAIKRMPFPNWHNEVFGYLFLLPCAISAMLLPIPIEPAPRTVQEHWNNRVGTVFKPILYPGRGALFIWYLLLMVVVTYWDQQFNDSPEGAPELWLSLPCTAVFFWSLLGNAIGRCIRRLSVITWSVVGCAIPSIAALVLLLRDHDLLAGLLFPFTLPMTVDHLELWPQARAVVLFMGSILLVGGIYAYFKQLHLEAVDRKAHPTEA